MPTAVNMDICKRVRTRLVQGMIVTRKRMKATNRVKGTRKAMAGRNLKRIPCCRMEAVKKKREHDFKCFFVAAYTLNFGC